MSIHLTALRASILLLLAVSAGAQPKPQLERGLVGAYHAFGQPLTSFPQFAASPATYARIDSALTFDPINGDFYGSRLDRNFAVHWSGYLRIERAGSYRFYLTADDAGRLLIDEMPVVEASPRQRQGAGDVALAEGLHPIRVEFYQNAQSAELRVDWKPFFGVREPLPDNLLFHDPASANVQWDKLAWEKRPKSEAKPPPPYRPGKYAKTDYGNFYSGTIRGPGNNITNKGIVISIGNDQKQATVCFDTDLLRWSMGWTDGWLRLATGRDGLEGQQTVEGLPVFATRSNTPGWHKGAEFKDPRPRPFGPLPRDWGKYKGLYLHGKQTILAYTIGDADVLEVPSLVTKDGIDAIGRTIAIGPSGASQTLLLFEQSGNARVEGNIAIVERGGKVTVAALVNPPAGAILESAAGDRIHLRLPPLSRRALFQIVYWHGEASDFEKFAALLRSASPPVDPATLIQGGSARWTTPLVTKGVLGADTGAYAMDTLTIPYENPHNSYMRMTGLDFFPDGRAAIANLGGDVFLVSGIDEKLETLTWKRFATGLFQPLGIVVRDYDCSHCAPIENQKPKSKNPHIYALGRDQITRLHDLNHDGEADFYENFNNDCHVQPFYHEFAVDLHTDAEGNFYYMKGSDLGAGGTIHNGAILKVSPDGSKLDVIAVGFRAPNGMGVGPNGEITAGDNQGNWTPLCPINWIRPGGFYGHPHRGYPQAQPTSEREKPLCWLPMEFDNSNGSQVWVTSDKWGPLKGSLLHLSYGKCSLMLVMHEDAAPDAHPGLKQGGVVRFPFKFISGAMRGRFHPVDGQLYVSGMKGWQTDANLEGCFHRVRYTAKPACMPVGLKIVPRGIQLVFTDALDEESASEPDNYGGEWFNVKRSREYGSKEYSPTQENKLGREDLEIESVKVSEDRKTVTLVVPSLRPVTNVKLFYKLKAADGAMISDEIAHTIHVVPE